MSGECALIGASAGPVCGSHRSQESQFVDRPWPGQAAMGRCLSSVKAGGARHALDQARGRRAARMCPEVPSQAPSQASSQASSQAPSKAPSIGARVQAPEALKTSPASSSPFSWSFSWSLSWSLSWSFSPSFSPGVSPGLSPRAWSCPRARRSSAGRVRVSCRTSGVRVAGPHRPPAVGDHQRSRSARLR